MRHPNATDAYSGPYICSTLGINWDLAILFVALQKNIVPDGILLVASLVSTVSYATHSQERGLTGILPPAHI